ncbi:MAG: 3-phosphoshikimate 1-carboxyvinyltransferase [Pelagibacteraceae bacterium]|nr:3-phosphoshikimate 1-carboxyvinyltransferase [Pelagibacteraceae bacterium]|tara:strand:- start:4469 stop:5815 length:1347 start_codon:yes stop_codon:yes gene_type:complete
MKRKNLTVIINQKIKPFKKQISVDPDKSLSIRSFVIGSICQGISTVGNVLESDDVMNAVSACKKLGVKIKRIKPKFYRIFGNGLGSFSIKKNTELYFGNSGTASRLLIGALSTSPDIQVKLNGDHSLNKRSMKKLINLMEKFGAFFLPRNKYTFPLKMVSSKLPIGIKYNANVSAQLKSAVILAGLNSYGNTSIKEYTRSRDHTENLLKNNIQAIKIKNKGKKTITVFGKKNLNPFNIVVSGDPSSAAFFVALTLLVKGSSLKINNVGLNPTRIGFFEILKKQKANIKFINIKKQNNEIIGDVVIKSSNLKPIQAPASVYPKTTDEYLILFVIAALTKGVSSFRGIADLANKESSRAKEMKKILAQIGIKCKLTPNEMKIFGQGMFDARKKIIQLGKLGDHRVAMCTFILAILTNAKTRIRNFETVFTSSPSFLKTMKSLGAKFEIKK